ncbi:MAG TPA: adenosine kinase [Acidimicrobiales bacterium]|nr:adenosine kinase [Acidimicrobiales bacterium]
MGDRSGAFDVVAVGSALVDKVVKVEDHELAATGLPRATMTLIDADEAARLWDVGQGLHVAGGSAANTAVGAAALGARTAFVGRVGDDELGRNFVEDLRRAGVAFESPPAPFDAETGRCIVFVTPDGERTMRTHLGAAPHLGVDCLDESLVQGAGIVYLEGYLWDAPSAAEAVEHALRLGRANGAELALSLSDPGCVERHHDELAELVLGGGVDIVFGNEAEITALAGTDDFEEAAAIVRGRVGTAALTRGPAGSVVVTADEVVAVPAHPVRRVVDTTGAGDLYAAGFLAGRRRGMAPAACARLGGLAAADVISALGARPHDDLRRLAGEAGLL